MRAIGAADIGGTHARFAIATIRDGRVVDLGAPITLKTSEHASLQTAWEEFGRRLDQSLPRELAIAFAGPIAGATLKLTNNPWVIRPASVGQELGVERFSIVNDFGAVSHSIAALEDRQFLHICGPELPLPASGAITVIGPGTGLGAAVLLRHDDGSYDVIETEGGHIDFAPLDVLEDQILVQLRRNFRRVSVERVVSGRGLWNIYAALGVIENRTLDLRDEAALWTAALGGTDSLAAAALQRLCLSFGAVAGDLALAHGAAGVVIAGGVGQRLADHLLRSGFRERFISKGRFERKMNDIPVKLIAHPNPGLLGAAAAFARQHL